MTAGWLVAAEYNTPWVKTQALYLNNTLVTSTAAELNALDGITATVAELNIMDGVTKTTAELNSVYVYTDIVDISTGSSGWVIMPIAGTISAIYTVIDGTIATADAVLSFEISGTAVTDGGITIAYSGSAAGDIDSSAPTAANAVTLGSALEVITNGASTNTVKARIVIVITAT
jgi:hypothetical protein